MGEGPGGEMPGTPTHPHLSAEDVAPPVCWSTVCSALGLREPFPVQTCRLESIFLANAGRHHRATSPSQGPTFQTALCWVKAVVHFTRSGLSGLWIVSLFWVGTRSSMGILDAQVVAVTQGTLAQLKPVCQPDCILS